MFQALFTTYLQGIVPGTWFDGQANANLVAAAPDLYEALELFAQVDYEDADDWFVAAIQKARVALAKSRGEKTDDQ
jgi:hypothetical protein